MTPDAMRRIEAAEDLRGVVKRLANRQSFRTQPRRQRLAGQQLGHEKRHTLTGSRVVHREHMGMRDACERPHLLLESRQLCIRDGGGVDDFERHWARERRVEGAIDTPHAACSDQVADFYLPTCVPASLAARMASGWWPCWLLAAIRGHETSAPPIRSGSDRRRPARLVQRSGDR